jgi:hypothetical protein
MLKGAPEGAIISRFLALERKVLKMLMFVGVVNGNLPITSGGRRGRRAATGGR